MRALASSNALKFVGFSLAIGTCFAYYQVQEINKTLGTDILEYQLNKMREDLQEDNQIFNQENKTHYFFEEAANQIHIASKLIQIYVARLLKAKKYERTCLKLNQNVIEPSIRHYQEEKVFLYSDIIQQFTENNQFNNKLGSLLTKIQQKNSQIKDQNVFLLERFYELQQELLTAHIFGINPQVKTKIDLIYSYFRQRERYASKLLSKEKKNEEVSKFESENDKQSWIDEANYGFKIQYI